ncbi:ABC transporter permease [Gemella sp. GH3]|uniref:ABC transporter permease n=1 Tax=unclassified Gemella TaxID=2624949 RepID=UPI0015D0379E|nr:MULTISPECIES: ABC transporter permease [unclassified Gemella]MBF0714473.1 ABC transporter permease [Gemella sp. GH3.1]NYS51425.1 ABC transporter permease [Gemella sp. GH3]
MENVYRFFRRISFSYKMASVLSDWRTFFTIDLLVPLMQMMCYSLVGYYVYGAENIEKWVISNAIVTSAFSAIYRVGLQLARERASGTLSLMIATKTSIFEILLSSAISTMFLSFVSVVSGVSILSLSLGLAWTGQKILEFILVLILAIFVATCFGFLFSCFILLTTELHLVTNTIDKVLLIFTGANFPVSNFPYFVEQFCYMLPLTRSILLAQKLISGESVITNLYLIHGELILAFIFLISGVGILKFMEKLSIKNGTLDML